MEAKRMTLQINDRQVQVTVFPNETLLETLRRLAYFDVKCGCDKGDCGACAVLIDGEAIDSCLTLTWIVEDRSIITAGGLSAKEEPHPLVKKFLEHGATQCGYCTPGIIIAADSMLRGSPCPSDEDIRIGLSGNLCRCTGYTKVFQAVRAAAAAMRKGV